MASETGRKRRWWPLLLAPYVIGIAWTCVHPILSVVTGEAKCRGWFIDENSLDPNTMRLDSKYSGAPNRNEGSGATSLCDSLRNRELRDNVNCIRHSEGFEVTKVVPVSNAVAPTAETIVIVVPAADDWLASDFHNALLQLITNLSTPSSCPWLAKTILLVSPTETGQALDSTVSSFLNAYLGEFSSPTSTQKNPSLPTECTTGILRTLLVLDMRINETAVGELRILPQGRHGVLPNMDLVFAAMTMYSRSTFLDARRSDTTMIMHPYGELSRQWRSRIPLSLSPAAQTWLFELGNMFLFAYSLVMGPYPSHFLALDHGIDSLTIEGHFSGHQGRMNAVECVQKLEGVLRTLSNLHERLHHSITQYLLPSPAKFVSHVEYLLPNVLILLPLLIRAATLVLVDLVQFDLRAFRCVLGVGIASLVLFFAASHVDMSSMNALYAVIYTIVCLRMVDALNIGKKDRQSAAQSLQFLSCLISIYVHVPITLAHVSLACPSALLWSAMIAFPAFPIQSCLWQERLKKPAMLLAALPLAALVPNNIFHAYTPYVTTVFLPLHLLVSLLWLI